jgi:hypothetical protein
METSNIVLPKLTNINYFYWRKIKQHIFNSKPLWELVIDGYEFPSNEVYKSLDVVGKKYLKEFVKKDNESLSLIGNLVDESIFPIIIATESSKQAWNILNNTYEGETIAKLQTLRIKFENAKMNANESMNKYITKIQDIANQTRMLGEDISERRIVLSPIGLGYDINGWLCKLCIS